MWSLAPPSVDKVDAELTTALTYANGQSVYALSPAERAAIHVVYQLYDALAGQPASALTPPELNGCRAALEAAYAAIQVGGRLASLRSSLLACAGLCPYCGFGEVTQLDHYLPKTIFGELAVYPRNLIPSCGPCNNAKRTIMPDTQHPGFVHTYFAGLPNVTFLHADVSFVTGALAVTFRILTGLVAPDLEAKLTFQLDRLKLNARYSRQINKFLAEQRFAILLVHNKGMGAMSLPEYLMYCSASLIANFGRNDWRPTLLTALAGNPDFCSAPEQYLGNRAFADETAAAVVI